MTFSSMTIENVKEYLRIDGTDEDSLLTLILSGAKAFITGYTGLEVSNLDKYEDIPIVILVLCAEMYDNRQFTVDKTSINPVIKSILDMHSINLL